MLLPFRYIIFNTDCFSAQHVTPHTLTSRTDEHSAVEDRVKQSRCDMHLKSPSPLLRIRIRMIHYTSNTFLFTITRMLERRVCDLLHLQINMYISIVRAATPSAGSYNSAVRVKYFNPGLILSIVFIPGIPSYTFTLYWSYPN